MQFSVDVTRTNEGWAIVTASCPGKAWATDLSEVHEVARDFIAACTGRPREEVTTRIGIVRLEPDNTRSPAEVLQRTAAGTAARRKRTLSVSGPTSPTLITGLATSEGAA